MEKGQMEHMKEDLLADYQTAMSTFADAPEEGADALRLFSFLCLLSFDVYVKKQIIEKLIDSLPGD